MKVKIINYIALCALITTSNVMASEVNSAILEATSEAHKSISSSKSNSPHISPQISPKTSPHVSQHTTPQHSPKTSPHNSQHNSPQLSPRNTLKHSSSNPIIIPKLNLQTPSQGTSFNADSTSSSPSQTPTSPRSLSQESQSSDALQKRNSKKALKLLLDEVASEEKEELKNQVIIEKVFKRSNTDRSFYQMNTDGTLDEDHALTPEDKRNVNNHYKATLTIDTTAYITATHLITAEKGAQEFNKEEQFSAQTTLTLGQVNAILQTEETVRMLFAFDNFGNSYHISNFKVTKNKKPSSEGSEETNSTEWLNCFTDKKNNQYECYFDQSKIIIDQVLGEDSYNTLYSEEMPEEIDEFHLLLNIDEDQWIAITKNHEFCMCTYLMGNDGTKYECILDGSNIIITQAIEPYTIIYSGQIPEKEKPFTGLTPISENQFIMIDENNNFHMKTMEKKISDQNEKQHDNKLKAIFMDKNNKKYECFFDGSKTIINEVGDRSGTRLYFSEEIHNEVTDFSPLLELSDGRWIFMSKDKAFCFGRYLENNDKQYTCIVGDTKFTILEGKQEICSENIPQRTKTFTALIKISEDEGIVIDKQSDFHIKTIKQKTKISTPKTTSNTSTQPETNKTEKTLNPNNNNNNNNNNNRTAHKIIGTVTLAAIIAAILYHYNKIPTQLTEGIAYMLNSLGSNRFYSFAK